jgi:uncharacterized protein YeaO (DUF488 family)
MSFVIKRVYEAADSADGVRVLVDRLWPRGVTKERAALDYWLKAVAPSAKLRLWFAHDPEKFGEFTRRYQTELETNGELAELRKMGRTRRVTLLYAAHDPKVNHAIVLRNYLTVRKRSAAGDA